MASVVISQNSFNGGELSSRMSGRIDQNIRAIGLTSMRGYIPLLQGPAEACPGFIDVAAGNGDGPLVEFEYNVTQSYLIEFGEEVLRFFTNNVQIEEEPGVPYEVESPWTEEEAWELGFYNDRDVLYICHRNYPIYQLQRIGAEEFQLVEYELRNGPWASRNWDEDQLITPSGTTGAVTLTANFNAFTEGDVGGLIELETMSLQGIGSWQSGVETTFGQIVQSNGNVYQKSGGEQLTGPNPPSHVEGKEYDGPGAGEDVNGEGPYGVEWEYLYNRFGQLRITSFTSATQVGATVIDRLANTVGTWRWRFGAFSDRRGYPHDVTLWQQRLTLGKDATVYCSVNGSYDDFSLRNEYGDISRDQALTVALPDPNVIRWFVADSDLVIGTARAEHVISALNPEGIGPGNVQTSTPSENGSADADAAKIEGRAVYIQRGLSKVQQLSYAPERRQRDETPDLTRYADHISGQNGFAEMVYQQEPERLIWLRTNDGELKVAGYVPDELMLGWCQRPLPTGWTCTAIGRVTDPDGRYHQLWAKLKNGSTSRICRMAPIRRGNDSETMKVMSDLAVVYEGEETDTVTAPVLAGETVEVVTAGGRVHRNVTLDDQGEATLNYETDEYIVGLPFEAEMQLAPLEGGSQNGTAQGKLKRVHRIDIRYVLSEGIEVACHGQALKQNLALGNSVTDQGFELQSGDLILENIGSHDRDAVITIRRFLPRPQTICMVRAHGEVSQR